MVSITIVTNGNNRCLFREKKNKIELLIIENSIIAFIGKFLVIYMKWECEIKWIKKVFFFFPFLLEYLSGTYYFEGRTMEGTFPWAVYNDEEVLKEHTAWPTGSEHTLFYPLFWRKDFFSSVNTPKISKSLFSFLLPAYDSFFFFSFLSLTHNIKNLLYLFYSFRISWFGMLPCSPQLRALFFALATPLFAIWQKIIPSEI